jgi:hypothetical protein
VSVLPTAAEDGRTHFLFHEYSLESWSICPLPPTFVSTKDSQIREKHSLFGMYSARAAFLEITLPGASMNIHHSAPGTGGPVSMPCTLILQNVFQASYQGKLPYRN